MKKNNSIKFFLTILFIFFTLSNLKAEIIILSSCDNSKDGFLKNEYILDLEKSLMTRNYVYNSKTFRPQGRGYRAQRNDDGRGTA